MLGKHAVQIQAVQRRSLVEVQAGWKPGLPRWARLGAAFFSHLELMTDALSAQRAYSQKQALILHASAIARATQASGFPARYVPSEPTLPGERRFQPWRSEVEDSQKAPGWRVLSMRAG